MHTDPTPPPAAREAFAEDRRLVATILSGSTEAWQGFVLRFTPVIQRAIAKVVFEEEARRTIFVEVLDALHGDKLRTYEGRASLSTWITRIAANRARDHLRARRGRFSQFESVERLGPRDRQLFRYVYEEGLPLDEARRRMGNGQGPVPLESLIEGLQRIRASVDPRVLQKIAYHRRAEALGVTSGKLLKFLDEYRGNLQETMHVMDPESQRIADDARRRAVRVIQLLRHLPPLERQALELKFVQEMDAHSIARETRVANRRSAYGLIEKAIQRMRRLAKRDGLLEGD